MSSFSRAGVAACVALCANVLPGAQALRRQEQSPWPAGFEHDDSTTPAPEIYGETPKLAEFKRIFIRRRNIELFDDDSARIRAPQGLQMVLGVWTKPYQKAYREVVRETWMTQDAVCPLKDGPQEGCHIYTTFVLGTSGDGKAPLEGLPLLYFDGAKSEADMMLLKTPEARKHAKSLEFFYRTAQENPWATHVAKLDMMTYPLVPKLLNRMWENKYCAQKYQLLGEPMRCNRTQDNDCDMPEFTSKMCRIPDCKHAERPFDYIAGPFLAMSRDLAIEAFHPTTSLYARRVGMGIVESEDHAVARNIHDWGFEKSECIQVWDPVAVSHPKLRYDPMF